MMCSHTEEVTVLDPYADKWRAFGFNVIEIDGHNMEEIVDALDNLPASDSDRPTAIIAQTIKGKGVDFMERNIGWHAGSLNQEDYQKAVASIERIYGKEAK